MLSWLFRFLAVALGLLAVLSFAVLLGIGTEAGSRTSWNIALGLVTSKGLLISGEPVSGTWLDGLAIENLVLHQEGADGTIVDLSVGQVRFQWQPWRLLDSVVVVDSFTAAGIRGQFQPAPAASPEPLTDTALQAILFNLPVQLEWREVSLTDVEFRVDETAIVTSSLNFGLQLDSGNLRLQSLAWQQDQTTLAGELSLSRSLAIAGNLQWEALGADQSYQGNLQIGGSLYTLELSHLLALPMVIQTTGTLNPGLLNAQSLQFSLTHDNANLDLGAYGVQGLVLTATQLTTSGTPADVAIAGSARLQYPRLPETVATVTLHWRNGQLVMDSINLENTELQLGVSGNLQPSPLALQASWQLDRLSPGERFPQFRLSDVTGNGSVDLRQEAELLETQVDIQSLRGVLNERALDVSGKLTIAGASLIEVQLEALTGDNRVSVQGAAGDELDLAWAVQAPALVQIWEGIGGSVQGQGKIGGSLQAPLIEGELVADSLQLKGEQSTTSLKSARLQARYEGEQNSIRLNLQELASTSGVVRQLLLQDAELDVEGSVEQHRITASIVHPLASLDVALAGAFAEAAWRGTLQTTSIESGFGDWAQLEAVNLSAGANILQMQGFCMARQITTVCANISGSPSSGLDLAVSVDQLPLAWANRGAPDKPAELQQLQDAMAVNLPAGLTVEGTANLELLVSELQGGQWGDLSVTVVPSDLLLQLSREQESDLQTLPPIIQRFGFSDMNITLTNSNQRWQGALGFAVAEVSETQAGLQGRFSGEAGLGANGDIEGNLNFNFADLAWLESVIPGIRNSAGGLNGQAVIQGSRSEPLITASINVENASVQLPAYGLQLQGIRASMSSAQDNTISLTASAESGTGQITLDASILQPLSPQRQVTAHLQGVDFTALQNETATLNVSPDLTLHYAENALQLTGQTLISKSHLDLESWVGELSNGAISESRDTVIVRSRDGSVTSTQAGRALELSLDIGLSLGEQVTLSGYGLDVSLGGTLDLEQEPGRPLLAYGELQIPTGTYEVYNQTLSARNGRLLFFGNPANPVLDIRAFRETASAEVGLMLTGPVNRIQGELYSTPPLPENEVLALLVTGKSFNNVGAQDSDALLSTIANYGIEKGQGLTGAVSDKLGLDSVSVNGGGTYKDSTLGLGKYITPNILMSYKVGLFDKQVTLSINYTLTEHLKLAVESGISQSVDISYTLEQE